MTKKWAIVLFIVVGILAALLGWLSAEALAAKIKRDKLADGLGEVQRAVETYAVNHNGTYPMSLSEVLAAGTLAAMPENPYTKQPMPVLAATDDPVPGGVVYVPMGSRVKLFLTYGDVYYDYLLAAYGEGKRSASRPSALAHRGQDATAAVDWSQVAVFMTHPQDPSY